MAGPRSHVFSDPWRNQGEIVYRNFFVPFGDFQPKTSKRADTCHPQLGSFLLGFQRIPTVIKKCSYFKPYFVSVEVCHYQEFPACPITESPINFVPPNM